MLTGKNLIIIGLVIVIAVILQVTLISVGKADDPVETALDFTKAYFMLDGASMSKQLCRELAENKNVDIVDEYLAQVAEKARSMGFSQNYMKNQLSHVSTEIQRTDKNSAKVRITGKRLRSINPVYAFVGRLFSLIESHKFDKTLTLVKEEGKWKVCGNPFSQSEI